MSVRGIGSHGHNGKDRGADSEIEDELSTTTIRRVTPRQSSSEQAKEAESMQTPYANVSEVFNPWRLELGLSFNCRSFGNLLGSSKSP